MTGFFGEATEGYLMIERVIAVEHAEEAVILVTGKPHGDRVFATCTCEHWEHYADTLDDAEVLARAHLNQIHKGAS